MSELREAGFFRELPYGYSTSVGDPSKPSLLESMHKLDKSDKKQIVAFLKSGNTLAVAPCVSKDVLDPNKFIGTLAILTDGTWVWSDDLAYYVQQYNVALPSDFLTHMQNHGWQAKVMTHEELALFCP